MDFFLLSIEEETQEISRCSSKENKKKEKEKMNDKN